MNRTLASDNLFEGMMRKFKQRFDSLAEKFQGDVEAAIETHLNAVHGTLDMIRADNIALESERSPQFRQRVDVQVELAKVEIGRIQGVIDL